MIGTVSSNKMQNALIVTVKRSKVHPKYNKRLTVKKRYPVQCEDSSKFKIGQEVEIVSCAPVSKTINFKVVTEKAKSE